MSEPAAPVPSRQPTEAERQAMVDRIQQALAEDQIEFSELDERFAKVYAATTAAELEAAGADLAELRQPPPPAAARHLAPGTSVALFGDIKIGGWISVEGDIDASTAFGDIVVDLSSAHLPAGETTVVTRTLFGDTKVIVPEGARIQAEGLAVFGDRREMVTAPSERGPIVRVSSFSLFGDFGIYSLSLVPVGALRRAWAALRGSSE